jgi:FUN14 domain-containing protein 1
MHPTLGMGFVTLQTLQYSGYIQVDHRKLRTDVEKMLDLDKDGTIDHKDATVVYNKLLTILQYNMPGGGGFVAGFVGGLRSG